MKQSKAIYNDIPVEGFIVGEGTSIGIFPSCCKAERSLFLRKGTINDQFKGNYVKGIKSYKTPEIKYRFAKIK